MIDLISRFISASEEKQALKFKITSRGTVSFYRRGKSTTINQVKTLSTEIFDIAREIELTSDETRRIVEFGPDRFLGMCAEHVQEQQASEKRKVVGNVDLVKIEDHFTRLTPYMDVLDNQMTFMYDSVKACRSVIEYKTFQDIKKSMLDQLRLVKAEVNLIPPIISPAVICFDPFGTTEILEENFRGETLPKINTYRAPEYLKAKVLDSNREEYISIYKKMLKHLIPNTIYQERINYWIYYMLTARNIVIPILLGPQGTGKTDFVGILCGLVGTFMSAMTKNDSITAKFNAAILGKRLMSIDEPVIKSIEAREAMKKFTNDVVRIEEKHKEPRDINNFCNFIFTANIIDNISIWPDDRRYMVLPTTEENPNEIFGDKEYSDMKKLFQKDEFLMIIRDYILDNFTDEKYNTYEGLHNHEFEQAVVATANSSIYKIFNALGFTENKNYKEEYSYSDLISKAKTKEIIRMGTIRDRLRNFKWHGKPAIEITWDQSAQYGDGDYIFKRIV